MTYIHNAFSNAIVYNPNGQSVSTAVNVDGNVYGGFYAGGGLPLYKKILHFRPMASGGYTSFNSYINTQENTTENYNVDGSIRSEERRVGKECRYRWAQYH